MLGWIRFIVVVLLQTSLVNSDVGNGETDSISDLRFQISD